MDWANIALLGVIGLAVGSFLNVCIDRLPAGQSLLSPPSHCASCKTRLRPADLVPVASYLLLRGRCRYCSAPVPWRTFLVELATGALFAFICYRYGLTYQGIAMLGYASLFIVVFVADLEQGIIPNLVVLPGLAATLLVASFWPEMGPARAAIGAAIGLGILLVLYLIPGQVIGEGDVKLAAVVGAATGFPLLVVGLALAFVSGGIIAIALLASRKKGRQDRMPFGPFIAVGALVALMWGDTLGRWYFGQLWPG